MQYRKIPLQGIGQRGDIIQMEKEHTCECCEGTERYDQSPEPH